MKKDFTPAWHRTQDPAGARHLASAIQTKYRIQLWARTFSDAEGERVEVGVLGVAADAP